MDDTINQNILSAAREIPCEDITIDNKAIVLKESKLILVNEGSDHQASVRIDTYNIEGFFDDGVLMMDFYYKLMNHCCSCCKNSNLWFCNSKIYLFLR